MGKKNNDEGIGRVRTPRDGQVLGVVLQKMGHGRFKIYCADGKERITRIPGSKRRGMWIKNDDIVLIEPWSVQGDEKGDLVWKYTNAQANWLEQNNYLDDLKEFL